MSDFPICVVVYLTNHCYLKCNHCFLSQLKELNKNNIEYNVMIKTLEELKNNNVFMIAYTGGDPLLHPNIFEILQATTDLGMMPLLGISGYNLTEDTAKRIYQTGVRCVQIGLNGSCSEVNDKYRGENSFGEVVSAIKILQKNNINVNLSFCIDKDNYNNLEEMLNFSLTNNIYKVKIEFWRNLKKNSNKVLNLDEKTKIYETCINFMKKNNLNDWIQCPREKSNLNKIRNNAIVIMSNGDVKSTEIENKLGNINDESIEEILKKRG